MSQNQYNPGQKQDVPDRLKQIARNSVENGGRRAPRNENRNGEFGSTDFRKEKDAQKVCLWSHLLILLYFINIINVTFFFRIKWSLKEAHERSRKSRTTTGGVIRL